MKLMELGMILVTGLFFFSTAVCGLWIANSSEALNAGDLYFHMMLAVLTGFSTLGTIITLLRRPV